MATLADDTAVMAIGETIDISTRKLQSAVNKVTIWTRKWRIKLNESRSVHTDFTNNKIKQQPIFIHGTKVPYANTAKYLGMTLDAKLRWKEHIKKKHDEFNVKFRKMYWLLG
jgi:predicted GIY-YIG superfamily endonuclease